MFLKIFKKKSQFSKRNNFLFIAFQKNNLRNIVHLIEIYQFMVLDIVYSILNPRNKHEVQLCDHRILTK